MVAGYLSLVLHAHLPYVHHLENDVFEERWLFESLADCYLPLLRNLTRLQQQGISAPITISVSPTLITMLQQPLVHTRFKQFLDNLLSLAESEIKRTQDSPENSLARLYQQNYRSLQKFYCEEIEGDILDAFKVLSRQGSLELITCAGTHGFLPLMFSPNAVEGQIAEAVRLFETTFGYSPKGLWLPECAYFPGLDSVLRKYNILYSFVDSHGFTEAIPAPPSGVYNPVVTPKGLNLFARDPKSAEQVWSSKVGYPGDYDYREYYRDIGFDLDLKDIGAFLHPLGFRHNTGFKYYRITGKEEHKDLYRPDIALDKANLHAGHFCDSKKQQVLSLQANTKLPPIIVTPFDAELFGHWWYEGPAWLDLVLRKLACDCQEIKLTTPSRYLEKSPPEHIVEPPRCSWGEDGSYKVWLNSGNHWIYRHLHQCETKLIQLTNSLTNPSPIQQRVLQQCTRELYLAQSSDWAFIMKTGTTIEYANRRTNNHIENFTKLASQLEQEQIDLVFLAELECRHPIFPLIDYTLFETSPDQQQKLEVKKKTKVLLLSWEYPPQMVGGLARHVYDLSHALVQLDMEVHVVTSYHPDCPAYQLDQGVHVHRVAALVAEDNFWDWIFSLNVAIKAYCDQLCTQERFDLIHVHDWLTAYAAINLKKRTKIPLVATIHATEYGRNNGLHNHMQRHINGVEWELTYESQEVICCSEYMFMEIQQLFSLPATKLHVIPNGVNPLSIVSNDQAEEQSIQDLYAGDKIIFYVGRLVREKGVQILLEAMPTILKSTPNTTLLIAGKGPMLQDLQEMTKLLGMDEKVRFLGFIDDKVRNNIMAQANVAVFPSLYEPFGIVALESMAAGVPVVISATGGLSEIVEDGIDGLKVPPGDVQALSAAVTNLLSDTEVASTLVGNALDKINRIYNWSAIAKKTIQVYKHLLT